MQFLLHFCLKSVWRSFNASTVLVALCWQPGNLLYSV